MLQQWARLSGKPTVLLLDEVDALVGDTLISLLRQIRAGYAQRPEFFPQSIVLCGVRDVRDYRLYQDGAEVIAGGSAFNIKAESLRMGNFTRAETQALWLQHSEATGQVFAPEIFDQLWPDTEGQPWLVNALGHEVTWKNKAARERSRPISLADYQQARERLIDSRATHLDQLSDKLREPRVHSVVSAIVGIFLEWPTDPQQGMYGPLQRVVIELKIQRGSLDSLLATGLEQTVDYSTRVGADEAHLLIFNRNPDVPWDQRIWQRREQCAGWEVGVWGA